MITGLKVLPVFVNSVIGTPVNLVGQRIKAVKSIFLKVIPEPGSKISFFIRPGYGIRHTYGGNGLKILYKFAGSGKGEF
jgi:hypothetical protein